MGEFKRCILLRAVFLIFYPWRLTLAIEWRIDLKWLSRDLDARTHNRDWSAADSLSAFFWRDPAGLLSSDCGILFGDRLPTNEFGVVRNRQRPTL